MFLNGSSKLTPFEFPIIKGPTPLQANEINSDTEVGLHSPDEWTHKGEAVLAEELSQKIRIACWIMTMPENHEKKAKHVKATWGRRCNVLLFMSSEEGKRLLHETIPIWPLFSHFWHY